MIHLLLFFLALSPEVQSIQHRIQAYTYAPQPTPGKAVHARIILEVGDLYRDTLLMVRTARGLLQIFRHDSLLLQQKNDTLSLMGSIFRLPDQANMDASFWNNAQLRKEGNLDLLEGSLASMKLKIWVDSSGKITKQEIHSAGRVVREAWLYSPQTGFLHEIQIRGSQGPVMRIHYTWED